MPTNTHAFNMFPQFSKLVLEDKPAYEALIADYPPVSDFSFAMLMTWWNALNGCAISLLNNNLVIAYWLPGLESYSGLSLVGKKQVDESIATLFDYLKERGEQARLVHVPEFVVSRTRYPELLQITGEREHDECILSLKKLADLESSTIPRRAKVKHFLADLSPDNIQIKSLDLHDGPTQDLLLECLEQWQENGGFNDINDYDDDATRAYITKAESLGMENVCFYLRGRLHGFLLYQIPADRRYVIINSGKFSYEQPYLFEAMVHKFAAWFVEQGFAYANIDSDLGVPLLRSTKLSLQPVNFLRKYTLTPIS